MNRRPRAGTDHVESQSLIRTNRRVAHDEYLAVVSPLDVNLLKRQKGSFERSRQPISRVATTPWHSGEPAELQPMYPTNSCEFLEKRRWSSGQDQTYV